MTLEAIGQRLGITMEKVRQIEYNAMFKMRRWAEEEQIPMGRFRGFPLSQ